MKVTVKQYYRSFRSFYLLLAGVPFASPLLRACIPDSSKVAEYFYPPLGDFQRLALAATAGTLLLTTIVVFICCQSSRRKVHRSVPAIFTAGWLLSVCVLMVLYMNYVRRVPVPAAGLEVPVSIGYQRTDFALRWYPQSSDLEMLHDRGPSEETIQKLWTQSSICVVRVLLWVFHTLSLACFLSVVCLAVYQHATEEVLSESESS